MSLPLLIPSVLMGKHNHQSSDRPQPKKATQVASSLLSKALSRSRGSRAPQTAAQNPTPTQPHDATPVRTRVPAVTSKARTTAPETDKSRPYRRKYPSTMRYRPH